MYKVVTEDLKSLGLRKNPTILSFPLHEWVLSPTVSYDKKDAGGIWCCEKLSAARALKKYFELKYGRARIFECAIGMVLFQNSYRTKTDKVRLITEIIE
jgi:hypothetical protein